MSEQTFDWSGDDEPLGSQETPIGSLDFQFDQVAFETLLMRAVRDQFTQNEDVVTDARQYLPRSDTQMLQVFEEFGLTRSGTEIFEPLEERDMEVVHDSFSGSAVFESSQESGPASPYYHDEVEAEQDDDIPYEGYDGGPLEFDTMEEAKEYAERVSREIFDEIVEELTQERLGGTGILDITFDEMQKLCMETVLPGVWESMDD